MRMKVQNRSLKFVGLGVVIFLLIIFLTTGLGERTLHVVQRPLVGAGTWISQRVFFLRGGQLSPEEVAKLQDRVLSLAIDRVKFDELTRQNKDLKDTLKFVERQDLRLVTASIIARSNTTQTSTFSIDRGEQDGVQVGDPVIVKDGVLVGKVVSVTPKSATVHSLADPSVGTAVSLLNQSQTIGVAEGIAGNLLRLKFIPQQTSIQVNDLVISSGLETGVPAGLFIGLVNDVRPEQNAPFLEAVIQPLVDIRQYTIVHVLMRQSL